MCMKTLWNQFVEQLLASDNSVKIFDDLQKRYSEKHRVYHNLGHVEFLLKLFRQFEQFVDDRSCMFFAIWFHDAIYEPGAVDNEKRSAELAVESLNELSLSKRQIKKVEKLILATEKQSAENPDDDGKLFLDFDLAILGTENSVYRHYAKAIRKEYSFVSDTEYRAGRGKVLQDFLQRDVIYLTDIMRKEFETKARENIAREILELV